MFVFLCCVFSPSGFCCSFLWSGPVWSRGGCSCLCVAGLVSRPGQGHCHSPASQCQPEPDSLSRVRQQHAPSPLRAPASTLFSLVFQAKKKPQYIETISRDLLFQMWRVYEQSQCSECRTTIICEFKIFHFWPGSWVQSPSLWRNKHPESHQILL